MVLPHEVVLIIQGLALSLIACGLIVWKWGPCDHDECKRTHARLVALDKDAKRREEHKTHTRLYRDAMCRYCQDDFGDPPEQL